MAGSLRVILEIGNKRRVVAGAVDWPGLDRWGTSEDDALDQLSSYLPRYVGVAERAGMAKTFAGARDVEVVERVMGSSSTDFWGIAHVPSQVEREVLSSDDLRRRLDLLRACWAYFDNVVARDSAGLRPGARGGGRSRDQIIRHVYGTEPPTARSAQECRLDNRGTAGRVAPQSVTAAGSGRERPRTQRRAASWPARQ